MRTARHVKHLFGGEPGYSLYRLSEPLRGYTYVVVIAVKVRFGGAVTYIFGASEDGTVVDWHELPGSFRGDLDHEAALRSAGYEVVS